MINYKSDLEPKILEAKFNELYLKGDIDKKSLEHFIEIIYSNNNSNKNHKNIKLKSLEKLIRNLSKNSKKRTKKDSLMFDYYKEIKDKFPNENYFLRYLIGDWDNEITNIVLETQKKYIDKKSKIRFYQLPLKKYFKQNFL